MTRRAPLVLAVALAAGCGGGRPGPPSSRDAPPVPAEDLALRVVTDAEEVAFGKAFGLTVVRLFSKDLVPEAWSDGQLAPLVVRLVDGSRRESATHVEETLRFRAYAFARRRVTVPRVELRARPRGGGPERVAAVDGPSLRVLPALPPGPPGPPEPPGDLLPRPLPWRTWSLLGAAALAVAASATWLVARRVRRRARGPSPAPPPDRRALERLGALRARRPQGRAEAGALLAEAATAVRGYAGERWRLRAATLSTEELLAAAPIARGLPEGQRALLADVLRGCDLVKFAGRTPDRDARERILAAAERFVLETRPGDAPPRSGAS